MYIHNIYIYDKLNPSKPSEKGYLNPQSYSFNPHVSQCFEWLNPIVLTCFLVLSQ